jgi:hypothetical protein
MEGYSPAALTTVSASIASLTTEAKAYVGVIAQDVQTIRSDAVTRGSDGYLRVYYEKIGLKFESDDAWAASGGQAPVIVPIAD